MKLVEFVTGQRQHYLQCYADAVAQYRQRFEQVTAEVMLLLPGDGPELYRTMRVDVLYTKDGSPCMVEVNGSLLEPTELNIGSLGGIRLDLHPIAWNGIEFHVQGGRLDEQAVRGWTTDWLDPDGRHADLTQDFGGIVHSVMNPRVDVNTWRTSIDFGSAPIEAFESFLSLLHRMAPTRISLGSFSMLGRGPAD